MKEKQIRVLVNSSSREDDATVKSARPSIEDILQFAPQKVIRLNIDALMEQLGSTYTAILDMLEALPKEEKQFKIKEVSFTLGIDSSGQVSLLSAVTSGITTQTGITFTIARE